MTSRPRLLAIIPARGGSKRLPRKNIMPLEGRPLVAWSIEQALACSVFEDVFVSTDDGEIAEIARKWGAYVPWLRPAELSTDTSSSSDVIQHALTWYEDNHGLVDAIVLLQPTSPFRAVSSIKRAIDQYLSQETKRVVVSVSLAETHPAWCFEIDGHEIKPFTSWEYLNRRSQDLPPAYSFNGSIYVVPASVVREKQPLLSPGMQAFVMENPDEALDIDTEIDWYLAGVIARRWQGKCDEMQPGK
jgi:CMP-N,N'-diacetyllegionaminic acid synthase